MAISSIFDSQSSIDLLISQMMQLERRPLTQLEDRRDALSERKSVLSDLDSKLSTLHTKSERLIDSITNYFSSKQAASSDTVKLDATATSPAQLGNHDITVDRLAVADTRVSQQYTDTNSDFTGFTTDQNFSIEVGHPTAADSANRATINITVNASVFTQTNDSVLSDIADAINTAMSDAVTADTIDSDEVIRASVVAEENGVSRLMLRSDQSGYTYRMDFTDSADNLLQTLAVNSASQSLGTAGGYITDVGTSSSTSLLNSKMTVDGLTFYRDSNNVADVISGVTMKLTDTFTAAEVVTVTSDTDTVKEEVQGFLDAYNGAMKLLRKHAITDPDTNTPGILARDYTYRSMINELRSYTTTTVTDVTNTDYSKLFNIGIEADDQGYLSFEDADKFVEALEANAKYVSDIFRGSDGVATQMESYLANFVDIGGTIDSSKDNIDDQLTFLNDRISDMEDRMARREAQLREEFATLQVTMNTLVNQQNFFSQFSIF